MAHEKLLSISRRQSLATIAGIPMGFSCSPLWCNLYLMHYEIQFIQRLAKLGRKDIMSQFKNAYRYIDDLCWINTNNPYDFISPQQKRTLDNPYWIYPLEVLEIKHEIEKFVPHDLQRGIQTYFMNLNIEITRLDTDPLNFQLCKYDKKRSLSFKYTQYIKFGSNRPIKQSYAVAVSQTVPILYLSSSANAAIVEIQTLISTLKTNGFKKARLLGNIIRFLTSNTFPSIRFEMQVLLDNLR